MRTLRSLLLALAFSWCGLAHAQTVGFKALVVTSCGQATYPTAVNGQQNYAPFTITTAGVLCSAGISNGQGTSLATPLVSGTGGDTGQTLGTTVVNNFISAPATGKTRKNFYVAPQLPAGSTATITLCKASSGITPSTNVAGCDTFGVGGSLTAKPLEYVPQDAWNAVASVSGVPVTITLIDQ